MPRRGIHPVLNKMTYVFRNGASVELPNVMFSKKPIIMQVVRRLVFASSWMPQKESPSGTLYEGAFAPQDPTSHPVWTGKERTIGDDDGRASAFSSKFDGFGSRPGGAEEEGAEPVAKAAKPVKQKKKKRS